jgi:hypothetical protein
MYRTYTKVQRLISMILAFLILPVTILLLPEIVYLPGIVAVLLTAIGIGLIVHNPLWHWLSHQDPVDYTNTNARHDFFDHVTLYLVVAGMVSTLLLGFIELNESFQTSSYRISVQPLSGAFWALWFYLILNSCIRYRKDFSGVVKSVGIVSIPTILALVFIHTPVAPSILKTAKTKSVVIPEFSFSVQVGGKKRIVTYTATIEVNRELKRSEINSDIDSIQATITNYLKSRDVESISTSEVLSFDNSRTRQPAASSSVAPKLPKYVKKVNVLSVSVSRKNDLIHEW